MGVDSGSALTMDAGLSAGSRASSLELPMAPMTSSTIMSQNHHLW